MTARRSDPVFALTSLSPKEQSIETQLRSLASWRHAGLQVRSFNHPSEIAVLSPRYDVEFVAVERTSFPLFGRHFVPINRMMAWAAEQDVMALLINADIELRLAPWELQRARRSAEGGLCYFIRHNHDGDLAGATREPYGIDAFLLSGRDAGLATETFLSMGQPFWDYWLPHLFAVHGKPLVCVDFPAAFHRNHALHWSWENWHRCGLEFGRITGQVREQVSLDACHVMARRVRAGIDRASTSLPPRPFAIRGWMERRFAGRGAKTFLKLGAHCGTDTAWLSQIPGVTIHAFEPDAATVGATIEVETGSLDSYARKTGISTVDCIWAHVQGTEGEMIRGGRDLLGRTRYLFMEYSDDELYEGQAPLAGILAMLPDLRVVELWADHVLLENRSLAGRR